MAESRKERILASRRVTDTRGREWHVGLRWLHHRPRWMGWGFRGRRRKDPKARSGSRFADLIDIPDVGEGWWIIVLILALVVSWFVVFPVVFFLLDLLLIVLLLAAAVAVRTLFRRPWIVEAQSRDETIRWAVVGYRKARRSVEESADLLARGLPLGPLADPMRH